ncbi:ATP-binding cassette domain-containing protein [Dactylosporangium sp. NPDC000244]|uniref:ATP-binding cassette domain-containing protein n=1 Tax=Dactylosporangium sp. NPDC000244 TaxID=3154365 RepID=UPI00331F6AFA
MRGVTKRFPGVLALDRVDFEVHAGEIHALVGGNGAGKSTLMAVASGALKPDSGQIEIAGRVITESSPTAARSEGLAIAFQHPALLPDLTVTENLMLSVPDRQRPRFSGATRWAVGKLLAMGMPIDPTATARTLTLAEKQAVEICGALACDPQVVIFDEPTEPFMAAETARLFECIQQLAARGVAVVYISHRLPDVFALADRITVLRDGQTRGTFNRSEVTAQEIVTRVAGREVAALFPGRARDPGEPVLQVQHLTSDRFIDVSVELGRHEILGLAGVEGNGQREFIRALGGAAPCDGQVLVEGRSANVSNPRSARRSGIVLMPQERHVEGVATVHSVRDNLAVAAVNRTARHGVIGGQREDQVVQREIASLGVKLASPEVAVETLSGGNQQKVVLGRALLSDPKVLLCDEPTQGIDVGVRSDIYHRLRATADNGVPVVVLSSDNAELTGLCDRVLVFSKGRVVADLTGADITDEAITAASLTGSVAGHADRSTASAGPPRRGWRRFLAGEQSPSVFLAAAVVALGVVGAAQNARFLSSFNIASVLELLAPVLFLAVGQLIVMMTGGIDLSVGPLSGTLVVVASFYVSADFAVGWWIVGFLLMILLAGAAGLCNGALVRFAAVTPVVATLVTYMALQGVSLAMRDTPGGTIAQPVTDVLKASVGPIPWAVLLGTALVIALEFVSRRSMAGLFLRGSGSDDRAAHKRGIPVGKVKVLAYVASSLCALLGGLLLAAQIGVGDPTAGTSYTLASITAVVLGGASIFGGRGSFIGVLFGVLLLQVTQNVAVFAGLSQAWQYWLPGLMALAATGLFAQAQRRSQVRSG